MTLCHSNCVLFLNVTTFSTIPISFTCAIFRDGPGLFQAGETVPHVFVNLRTHKLTDWPIFVGCDVIWGQMTSFDRPSWITHLKLILSQARMLMKRINSWSSANRKLEKKLQNYVKKFIFALTYLKFAVAMATSKW